MADGLAALRKMSGGDEEPDMRPPPPDGYQRRIVIQQLLNQVGPIFEAHAATGIPATTLAEGVTLRDQVETSKRLAIAVASRLGGETPVSVDEQMVRTVRPAMAQYVATKGRAGLPVDISRDAGVIVDAIEAADPKYDINPYGNGWVDPALTTRMTACAAVSAILAELALYDFRTGDGVSEAAARVLAEVMDKTRSVVAHVGGPDLSAKNRAAMTQSFVKHHAAIMASALGRKAQETVLRLGPMSAEGRVRWYENNDPIGEAIGSFREAASTLGALVLVLYDEINGAAPAPDAAPEPRA